MVSQEIIRVTYQAQVVQKVDNPIHRINHYSVDSVVSLLTFIHRNKSLSGG